MPSNQDLISFPQLGWQFSCPSSLNT